jgi:hypothetical protein
MWRRSQVFKNDSFSRARPGFFFIIQRYFAQNLDRGFYEGGIFFFRRAGLWGRGGCFLRSGCLCSKRGIGSFCERRGGWDGNF